MFSEPEKDSSGKPAPIVLDDDTAHLGLFLTRRTVYACLTIEGKNCLFNPKILDRQV